MRVMHDWNPGLMVPVKVDADGDRALLMRDPEGMILQKISWMLWLGYCLSLKSSCAISLVPSVKMAEL
jgi:hypothetical protein